MPFFLDKIILKKRVKLLLKKKTNRILYLNLIFTVHLLSQNLAMLMMESITDKIEIGVDYNFYQSIVFQEEFISQNYLAIFQNSGALTPYISLKSKGYSLYTNVGIYINSTFNYMYIDKQKAILTNGTVSKNSISLDTSIHYFSFDMTPSLFYFYDFGNIRGKNTILFEFFSGIGLSTYTGTRKVFIYPTQEEFQNEQVRLNLPIPPNFYISDIGEVAYIGEEQKIDFSFGLNFLYGLKIKYNFKHYNIHFIYKAPFVITSDEYLNGQQIGIGIGYSF